MVNEGTADLCSVDPGFDVDLFVTGSLRSMTSVWMGLSTLRSEIDAGKLTLTGDKQLAKTMENWLGLSVFAKEKPRTPAEPAAHRTSAR